MKLKISKYIKYSEPVSQDNGPSGKRIALSTRKSTAITVSNFVVDTIKESNFSVLPNHLFNVLMFHEMVIPNDQEETDEILKVKGIIGDDISENSQSIVIELNDLQKNEIKTYLENVIEKVNITPKLKTIFVELRGPLTDFNFNESILNDIKTYFYEQDSLSKINVEFNLICGIPQIKEKLINDIDLSWIETIQIIYFANEDTPDFIKAMEHLKTFTENLKLIKKVLARIILPYNYYDKIAQTHEIIKSIKITIFRFTLRKDSFRKLEDWSDEELRLLKIINEFELYSINFSEPAYKFLDETFIPKEGYHYEHFEDFILELKDGAINRVDKKLLNSEKVNTLIEKSPQCYECMFLSMCGGIVNKNENHNMDCPDIRSNIMFKSRMKYKI